MYLCTHTHTSVHTVLYERAPRGKQERGIMFNLLKPTGYGMHQQVEHFNNCTLCPHCIYVFSIFLRTNSDLCNLHHKLIGFITEMKSVYSAVRTGSLNEGYITH
jgi:hypothetical protein